MLGQYADIMAAARFLVKNVDKLDECGRQYAIAVASATAAIGY
jgi:hypothetical protein